jgi:hypothetical protein
LTILSENEIGKRCVAAALALCIAHSVTTIGEQYQIYAENPDQWSFSGARSGDLHDVFIGILLNYGIFLSPVIVLLMARRVCALVGVLAIPVMIFFVLRMHHVWQFYWFGINSMARQKGDELGWFTLIFEVISAVVAAPVALGLLAAKLIDGLGGWRKG